MEVFRITSEKYAKTLSTSGTAARWNRQNEQVLYTASSRSLASLEVVVHQSGVTSSNVFRVMVLSLADDDRLITTIQLNQLPANWRSIQAYPALQKIGSDWYNSNQSLILKVPSAIITREYNYLINTNHPDFVITNVSLTRDEDFFWDERLFK